MNIQRRNFLRNLAVAGIGCCVQKALCTEIGSDHRPVVTGADGLSICPVWENPNGDSLWELKTPYEIVADINRSVAELAKLAHGLFCPTDDYFGIIIPPSRKRFLNKEFLGYRRDVEDYIKSAWPNSDIICGTYTHFLEDLGYGNSAEFVVGRHFLEYGKTLVFSQYGI